MIARYFSPPPPTIIYPPEVHDYNEKFTELLQVIKHRHDPTVTTVAQGVLEWKRMQRASVIGTPIQEFLDRFYMSRIGIRFLIGQRECRSHDQLPLEFRPIGANPFVDIALNTLPPHPDFVGIICTRAVRTSSLTKCILSHIFLRISTISAKKLSVSRPSYLRILYLIILQITPATSVKNIMPSSNPPISSSSARPTSHSLISQVIFLTSVLNSSKTLCVLW